MTVKEYLKEFNTLVKKNPDLLNCDVVYSQDDEGNYYNYNVFSPTPGIMNVYGEFLEIDKKSKNKATVVCIN